MQYRQLGKTGWNVSVIGFGAWGIGGQWGAVSDDQAVDALKAGFDAGINLFDTADAYGEPLGRSEQLVGKALAEVRDKVIIASKVGNWGRRHGHPLPYTAASHVTLCCDASLHRLGMEHIDLYQCHIGDLDEPDVFLEGFETLRKQGKIRAYGISTNDVDVVRRFNREGTCASVQLDYSILSTGAEGSLLPYCQHEDIGTLIRGPLAKGIATGKFTQQSTFDDSVRKGWNDGPGRERFLKDVRRIEAVKFLEDGERTMAQAALQFVLSHPAVTCAIPGAKSAEQARANAAAGVGTLSNDEVVRVREVISKAD